ncbi:TPA: thymidylate synthase [Candidatus Wolfebacteria bacterium]|nr:thymidylate synthase [Candidatus Wolfebacteria bacterium]
MQQYLDLIQDVLNNGKRKGDPHGIGNLAVCGRTMRFDLTEGFPLITTKSMKSLWKSVIGELLWFLSGSTSIADLKAYGVNFWDQWADQKTCDIMGLPLGELGPIYGKQWRAFEGGGPKPVDQIQQLVNDLKTSPDSRRLIVSSWNPVDADRVFVAPCHCFYKLYHAEGELSLHLFQRSGDMPIGIPFNIAEYSLLLMMLAQITGLKAKEFIHTISDTHIYLNQIEFMREQLTRDPRPLPSVTLNSNNTDIFGFTPDDFILTGYDPHPYIKIPVAW